MLPVWFLTLFFIVLVLVIAALAVLFYFVFKPDDSQKPSTSGPQGPDGEQGEIGFTGLRGAQGFAVIGPQGPSGAQSRAASEIVATAFSFTNADNATFFVIPDEKVFPTLVTRIDRIITISGAQIDCSVNKTNANDFTLRVTVVDRIPLSGDPIVAFAGSVQTEGTNFVILLKTVTRIDDTTLGLIFQSNAPLWDGTRAFTYSCYFTVSYQTV